MKTINQMKSNQTTESINRGAFLRNLGMSSAALMAFYCMGTGLTACSKGSDPAPSTGATNPTTGGFSGNADTSKGAISFTLDLTNATYSALKTTGQYVIVGSLLVAKAKSGSIIALSKTCTHQGVQVEYRSSSDDIYCSPANGGHGSQYSTTGAVKVGPAASPLTQYKASLSTDGNTLTVTA